MSGKETKEIDWVTIRVAAQLTDVSRIYLYKLARQTPPPFEIKYVQEGVKKKGRWGHEQTIRVNLTEVILYLETHSRSKKKTRKFVNA